MHKPILCLTLPVLVATALAQAPTDTLNLQPSAANTTLAHTPRAAWSAVTSAGTTSPAGTGTGYGTWRNSTPAVSDGADAIYVFGGRKQSGANAAYNDLYKFEASTGTLTLLIADGVAGSPGPRERHAACWNPSNGKMYIYGGYNFATAANPLTSADCLGDIWEYDPGTNTWTDVTPAMGNPIAREFAAMAYDPALGGLIMFGGSSGATGTWNDTWLFLGGAWTQLSPATSPSPRAEHCLNTRYDVGDIIMDLGKDNTVSTAQVRCLDVWKWDGTTVNWVLLSGYDWVTPSGTFPASSTGTYSCYDPLRKRLVHPGGQGNSQGLFTGTSGTATCAPANGDHTYLYYNAGTTFYEALAGGPCGWTSEFDCLTNTWSWYSRGAGNVVTASTSSESATGRVSRNGVAFAPSTGKVYMLFGQNAANSGSKPTYNVYQYQANPVASATSYGTSCTGPGGPLALAADNLPWTERTWSCTATGLGPFSFGFAIVSLGQLAPGVPLVALPLPGPGAGCELGVASLDITAGLIPIAGSATFTLALPSATVDPTLPGLAFYTQIAELDFSAGWIGTYATNSLSCVIGSL